MYINRTCSSVQQKTRATLLYILFGSLQTRSLALFVMIIGFIVEILTITNKIQKYCSCHWFSICRKYYVDRVAFLAWHKHANSVLFISFPQFFQISALFGYGISRIVWQPNNVICFADAVFGCIVFVKTAQIDRRLLEEEKAKINAN